MITTARTRIALGIAAVAALAFAGAGAAQAAPPGTPAIPLNNAQESQTTGATGGAHGFFAYEITDEGEFCYTLEVEGLTAGATAAHVHVGPRNVAGPVVIPIPVPNATSFEVSACADPAPATSLLDAIEANPKAYYLNVHTPTFPGGEVRGQLK